ncbi:type II secretion system F family protein [Halanaerobium saccharolyticum]|jgi:type IV pilus assembly protein PilC|uniref:type II secretion system F family protein n=1 Tax=Halanaerobium saccharolyticum TaxID=43595 RepID=UPI003FCD4B96
MASLFEYEAKDRNGNKVTGELEADNKTAIATQLKEKGYYITNISVKKQSKDVSEIINFTNSVSTKELSVFSQQFATMIDSGISLVDSLQIMYDQMDNKFFRKSVEEILEDVETGVSLANAMQKHVKIFPTLYIELIRAGEAGGVLDVVLNKLADHYERQSKLNSMVKSALYYPLTILTVAILVVTFLVVKVVPQFVGMFSSLGANLPLVTRILLAISDFIRAYWWAILLFIVLMIFIFSRYRQTENGRLKTDKLILKIPVFGDMMQKIYLSRFSSTLSILVDSGVGLLESLSIVENVINNKVYSDALTMVRVQVREGMSLAAELDRYPKLFSLMVIQMTRVGEETGALPKMMVKISDFYDSEVETSVDGVITLIEPAMIVILAVVVGFVAVSIITPMFDMFQYI